MADKKLKYLDGIRGIMALVVMTHHFTQFFIPPETFLEYARNSESLLPMLAYIPMAAIVYGKMSLQYFFLLTGFLIGRKVMLDQPIAREKLIVKFIDRFLRFLPMIAFAVMFTYLTMILGLQYHISISGLVIGEGLDTICNFEPSLMFCLRDIFINSYLGRSAYVSPFWTIPLLFWGYIMCMLACYVFKDNRWRRVGLIAVALLLNYFVKANYFAFPIGALLADIYYLDGKDSTVFSRFYYKLVHNKAVLIVSSLIGLFLLACPEYITEDSIYIFLENSFEPAIYWTIGLAILLWGLLHTEKLKRFFENRLFLWLGEISFAFYALHWPIMMVVQSRLFASLYGRMSYSVSALLSFALTLPVVLIAAHFTHKYLEKGRDFSLRGLLAFLERARARLTPRR